MADDKEMGRILGIENLCLHQHPSGLINCMKLDGHKGAHWFMARWNSDGTWPEPAPDPDPAPAAPSEEQR